MAINFNKSACMRIGPRFNSSCANRKENGKVRYVTHMLHDYHVRSGVGHCVKNESYSSANLE